MSRPFGSLTHLSPTHDAWLIDSAKRSHSWPDRSNPTSTFEPTTTPIAATVVNYRRAPPPPTCGGDLRSPIANELIWVAETAAAVTPREPLRLGGRCAEFDASTRAARLGQHAARVRCCAASFATRSARCTSSTLRRELCDSVSTLREFDAAPRALRLGKGWAAPLTSIEHGRYSTSWDTEPATQFRSARCRRALQGTSAGHPHVRRRSSTADGHRSRPSPRARRSAPRRPGPRRNSARCTSSFGHRASCAMSRPRFAQTHPTAPWRNGRRRGFKIPRSHDRPGSSPGGATDAGGSRLARCLAGGVCPSCSRIARSLAHRPVARACAPVARAALVSVAPQLAARVVPPSRIGHEYGRSTEQCAIRSDRACAHSVVGAGDSHRTSDWSPSR